MALKNLCVKSKVRLPIWILSIFVLVVGGYGLHKLKTADEQGHLHKVKALVESAQSIAAKNYYLYISGKLTENKAKERARDAIRAMVFDGGARVFVFNERGIRIVSNALYPEGTSAWDSSQTKSMIAKALSGGGVTYYQGVRELHGVKNHNVPKAAWSVYYAPWGWVIASAVYLDDVMTAFWWNLAELLLLLGTAGVVVIGVSNVITLNLTRPLSVLTETMRQLAKGNTKITISGLDRGDEIGEMAAAMETFLEKETERHALQAQLKDLAYKDSLTGLPNRVTLYEDLRVAIAGAMSTGDVCALMIFDLDRFKAINDNIGHFAGDKILVEFAKRLQQVIGDQGKIGRLSGDEFFVILPKVLDKCAAEKMANLVLREVDRPIDLEGRPTHLSVSVGGAFAPDDSLQEMELYRFADMALYEAKRAGGACLRYYRPSMKTKAEQRFEMEALIKEGLSAHQFTAHFQVKIDLKTGEVIGAEALCRWIHPEIGIRKHPGDFIPVAEETGQIIDIGNQMLMQACIFATDCNRILYKPFVVAVNVSPKQLLHADFLAALKSCLRVGGCHPSWLELEITESLLIHDFDETVQLLEEIVNIGVSIAIDDFGTGYSAMSYLSRFPISCLKIDQSFVREMIGDSKKEVLVNAILAMSQGLGLKTVAEGVETEEEAQLLKALDCDYGQGYLWHRPVSAAEFLGKLLSGDAAG